jgi:hypothetical protein
LSEWLLVVLLAFGLPFDVDVTCPFAFFAMVGGTPW